VNFVLWLLVALCRRWRPAAVAAGVLLVVTLLVQGYWIGYHRVPAVEAEQVRPGDGAAPERPSRDRPPRPEKGATADPLPQNFRTSA